MKAITYQKNWDQFELAELPIPAITSDLDVLVAVDAVGLNPVDTKIKGVERTFDCVGGSNDILCASVLGFEGQMAEIVKVVEPEKYPDVFMKGLSFHQLALGAGHANGPKAWHDMVKAGEAVSALMESGEIRVPALEVINHEQIPEKLMAMRAQRTKGKIVARMRD